MKSKQNNVAAHHQFTMKVLVGAFALSLVLVVAAVAYVLGNRLVPGSADAAAVRSQVNGPARTIPIGPRHGLWVGVGNGKGIFVKPTSIGCSSQSQCEPRNVSGFVVESYRDSSGQELSVGRKDFEQLREGESMAFPEQTNAVATANQYRLLIGRITPNTVSLRVVTNTGSGQANDFTINSPAAGAVWAIGTTREIQWDSPSFARATSARISLIPYIACLHDTPACEIAQPTPYKIAGHPGQSALENCGGNKCVYRWDIPRNLASQYQGSMQIKVELLNADNDVEVVGVSMSDVFTIGTERPR